MSAQQQAQFEYQRKMQEELFRQQQAQQQAQADLMRAQQRAQETQQAMDNEPRWKYAVIAAVDLDRGFSKGGEIPWNYPEDFQWFKQTTSGHVCVMGKKTYEDINRRLKNTESVLPDRKCFVVSSTLKQEDIKNATVIQHVYDVINHLDSGDIEKTIFFIGGDRVFREGISLAKTIYLTIINKTFGCDKFFPVEYVNEHFVRNQMHSAESAKDIRFLTYVRK